MNVIILLALYPWRAATVPLGQTTKEMLWWDSGDVGVLVAVGRGWDGVVACATSLDTVEDDTDEDY